MRLRQDAEIGLIRDMVLQAKDAAEITHGDRHRDFLFELDEFQMREFIWLYRKSLQACSCAAGLPEPECPQHGVHSVQANAFYDNAYRAIQSKCAKLTGVLHRELLDTGLVTIQQWNDKIAPALVAIDQSIETPREWAERTLAPPQTQQRGPLSKTASYEAAQPAGVNPASTQTKLNTKGKA